MSRILAVIAAIGTTVAPLSFAHAYNVRTTAGGTPLRWGDGTLKIAVALDDVPDGMAASDAENAAIAAFDTYNTLLAGMAPMVTLELAMNSGLPAEGNDGINVVRWVKSDWSDSYDPGALAVTLTSYDSTTGRITDADIVVNAADYPWVANSDEDGCASAYDLQNVLTHEAGHFFGLAHDPNDPDATMFPSSGMCETKKRDLDTGDVAGLSHLYVDTVAPVTTDGLAALGCNVVGPRSASVSLLALLLVGGLLAASRRPRLAMIVALGAFIAPPASATTIREMSLDDLSSDAVIVVRGVVGQVSTQRISGHIYTDATVAVSECLKGTCGATVVIRQLGGEIEGAGMRVEGTADLAPGSEVVLMLRHRLDAAYAPLGMAQGAYRVERDAVRGEIRSLVHDASSLHYAKPDADAAVTGARGSLERITMNDLRAALARAARR